MVFRLALAAAGNAPAAPAGTCDCQPCAWLLMQDGHSQAVCAESTQLTAHSLWDMVLARLIHTYQQPLCQEPGTEGLCAFGLVVAIVLGYLQVLQQQHNRLMPALRALQALCTRCMPRR